MLSIIYCLEFQISITVSTGSNGALAFGRFRAACIPDGEHGTRWFRLAESIIWKSLRRIRRRRGIASFS
jgi:hypothetical protein